MSIAILPGETEGIENWRYFLEHVEWMLDQPTEWVLRKDEPVGGSTTYHIRLAVEPASSVFVSTYENGLQFNGGANITVSGIEFQHYNGGAVSLNGYTNNTLTGVTLQDCFFHDLHQAVGGDEAAGKTGVIIIDNHLKNVFGTAIRMNATNCTIANNRIEKVGTVYGHGDNTYGDFGIRCSGSHANINNNHLSEIGNSAIVLGGSYSEADEPSRIQNNFVENSLITYTDGAGITFDYCSDVIVSDNIINNIIGSLDGVADLYDALDPGAWRNDFANYSFGIYYGNHDIVNASVQNNTVTNCAIGVYVDHTHFSQGNSILNNLLVDNGVQLSFSDKSNGETAGQVGLPEYVAAYDNQCTGNTLYCLSEEQFCLDITSRYATQWDGGDDRVEFGTFNNNAYWQPFGEVPISMRMGYVSGGINLGMARTFEQWQTESGQDANLWTATNQQHTYTDPQLDPIELVLNGDFTNAANWNGGNQTNGGYQFFGDLASAPLVGPAAGDVGSYLLSFTASSTIPNVIKSQLWDQNNYVHEPVRFQAIGTTPESFSVRLDIPPEAIAIGDTRHPKLFHPEAILGITPPGTITLDNVSLRKATFTDVDPYLNNLVYYNCPLPSATNDPQNAASFSLDGCWADVYGTIYTGTVTLEPWESIVLYNVTTTFDIDQAETHITTNTTWNTDRNVRGRVIVDAGKTLTIENCTIGFALSTPTLPTDLTVMPGATLVVQSNAELTSVANCGTKQMWSGIKVLGNGTTIGAGKAIFLSGGKVSNAHTATRCAEGDMLNPLSGSVMTGGIVQATDATFENNRFDIVTRPHADIDPVNPGPSFFERCSFRTTAPLNDPQLWPGSRINLFSSANTRFTACTYENTAPVQSAGYPWRGMAFHTINTKVDIAQGTLPTERSRVAGFDMGILHSAFDPTKLLNLNACDFAGNARGVLVTGADNSKVTQCTFTVPDAPVSELSVEGAYGAYILGCSGFEFEENTFEGDGDQFPKVGAVFSGTGLEDNFFYNNTFNRFHDVSSSTAGTIIMGINAGADGTGLRIKCNDYSGQAVNDFDVAFTDGSVAIAQTQGTVGVNTTSPAGNTFGTPITCNGDERHLFVQTDITPFTYAHHQPQSTLEFVPHCASAPIMPLWYNNTTWPYDKPVSCPVDLSEMVVIDDDETVVGVAHTQQDILKDVYTNWRDGGNTEGLGAFVRDLNNSSYAVRNELMLVAPKVGADVWKEVFTRSVPLNPWHLVQALIANSPLEAGVMELMEQYSLTPFYKQLVRDNQDGSISMHTLFKSDIAHFYSEKATATQAMVRKSLLSGSSSDMALTLATLNAYPTLNMEAAKLAMHLAAQNLVDARAVVDDNLQPTSDQLNYWVVQDLLLTLKEQNKNPMQLATQHLGTLQGIAASDGPGSGQAQAWLALLGTPIAEVVTLPIKAKRFQQQREFAPAGEEQFLAVYPNPANGPAYLVYKVPDGVEKVYIALYGGQGQQIRSEQVAPKNGILEIAANEIVTGLYVASIYFDNIEAGSIKLSVTR